MNKYEITTKQYTRSDEVTTKSEDIEMSFMFMPSYMRQNVQEITSIAGSRYYSEYIPGMPNIKIKNNERFNVDQSSMRIDKSTMDELKMEATQSLHAIFELNYKIVDHKSFMDAGCPKSFLRMFRDAFILDFDWHDLSMITESMMDAITSDIYMDYESANIISLLDALWRLPHERVYYDRKLQNSCLVGREPGEGAYIYALAPRYVVLDKADDLIAQWGISDTFPNGMEAIP